MRRTGPLRIGLLAILALGCVPVYGDGGGDREKELEQLVRELTARIDRLERRIDELENRSGGGVPPSRIEKLERKVEKIQEMTPSTDSEEWKRFHAWMNNPLTMRTFWKDALHFESLDKSIRLKIGGRIHNDYAYFVEDGDVERRIGSDFDDGTEFRRARLYIAGTLYHDIEFKAQYDFAGGDADFKDVYVGVKHVPYVGNVRVGQLKEPFGLEELTSSNYITFMERSLVGVFTPGRHAGVMVHDHARNGRMTWAAGVFRQTDSFGDNTDGRNYDVTARVTGLPIYEDDGKRLLHLGLAYTHRNYEDDRARFRERPESHLSPRVVDTRAFPAEYGDFLGVEAAWVDGPFSLQGEYVQAFVEGRTRRVGDPRFWAASLQASYFLTGEHRPYKTSSGTFTRVKPLRNFGRDGGPGAWELAARYSYLNLNDGLVRGGRLHDLTLGVNWYWNPNLRMMWNYVLADPSRGGDVSIFQWRIQLAF